MTTQLAEQALQGFSNWKAGCPFLATSDCHAAWAIGRWLAQRNLPAPRDVRPSRGSTYHVNGMKVRVDYVQGCTEIQRID